MFIWDFVADTILEQIMDWVYKQIIGFLANFFAEMGNMGAEMFEMSWVQSIVLFFSYLAWILYAVGFVVACAECGLEYSSGRADVKGTAMNLIKGFMAVSLFILIFFSATMNSAKTQKGIIQSAYPYIFDGCLNMERFPKIFHVCFQI